MVRTLFEPLKLIALKISIKDEPGWMTTLRTKVPQSPNCGQQPQHRIYGGIESEINEHPWTVLLKYNKREIILFLCCIFILTFLPLDNSVQQNWLKLCRNADY